MVDVDKLKKQLEYLKTQKGKDDPAAVFILAGVLEEALDELDRLKGKGAVSRLGIPKKPALETEGGINPPTINNPPEMGHNFK